MWEARAPAANGLDASARPGVIRSDVPNPIRPEVEPPTGDEA